MFQINKNCKLLFNYVKKKYFELKGFCKAMCDPEFHEELWKKLGPI